MRKYLLVIAAAHMAAQTLMAAPAAVQELTAGNTGFATDLYAQLKDAPGNLFFSPYSLSTALGMTYGGAREETARQMTRVLHFTLEQNVHSAFAELGSGLADVQKDGSVELALANSLWPQAGYPFLPEYLDLVKKNYGVSITACDYINNAPAARNTINDWVEGQTRQKIKDLIPAGVLTPLTRLVLANAIYFKGNWAVQFNAKTTARAPFHVSQDKTTEVPMMSQRNQFGYAEFDDLQALALPYKGDALSMVVLLPKQPDGLAGLQAGLSPANLEKWTRALAPREVQVFLPRFKMTGEFKLNDKLKALGMTDAFDDAKADFSGMDGMKHHLYISAVLHKAFVEVNETGTEAAAATAVIMALRGPPSRPLVFRADHPFLFLIRDNKTGSVLFLGRMVNPAS